MKFKSSIVLALLFVCRSLCAQIVLENEACTLVLSEDGYAVSLYDKAAGRECLDTQAGTLPLRNYFIGRRRLAGDVWKPPVR